MRDIVSGQCAGFGEESAELALGIDLELFAGPAAGESVMERAARLDAAHAILADLYREDAELADYAAGLLTIAAVTSPAGSVRAFPAHHARVYPEVTRVREELARVAYSVTVERLDSKTAGDWFEPREAGSLVGRLAVVERHDGRLWAIPAVAGRYGIGDTAERVEQAAQGTAQTYGAVYLSQDIVEQGSALGEVA
jgi:hypothetical protein